MKKLPLLLLFILFGLFGFSQTYTLQVTIKNQPDNKIILGKIRGDRFIPVDSMLSKSLTQREALTKTAIFKIPESETPLMYRLIFGQTLYAKVMNEPPEHLDFIFNDENIEFQTCFDTIEDSLIINRSEENKAWFAFMKRLKMYGQWMSRLQPFLHNSQINTSTDTKEIQDKKNEYNRVLMEREAFIQESVNKSQNLFASKLMKMYREPLLDAYLSKDEWLDSYKKMFFNVLDFSDPDLVNTSVYTEKIIQYIQSYGQYGLTKEQQENEFIKAVDVIMSHVNKNPVISELILDYIVRGFETLNLQKALAHIAEKYSIMTCQTNEKTTLERRLNIQKMKPGNPVPDFTLNDLYGNPITLSKITKKHTLILFWASWCRHCNSLIPKVKKWSTNIDPNDFEIVAISIDTSETAWQNKVKELGITSWKNLSDFKEWDGKVTRDYNIYATPTMFLIDKNLKIIAKPLNLDELIDAFKMVN
jgi:peroxiredoxin